MLAFIFSPSHLQTEPKSVVRTILLYGCETGPLRVADQRRLEVSVASADAAVKIVSRVSHFDSAFELCLRCFFSVEFVGLDMLRDVMPAKSLTRSLQRIGARGVVANSKRG